MLNVSEEIYRKALEATIEAVKRGVEGDRAINAGINVIRGSSWFQKLEQKEQSSVEVSFRESMQKEFGLKVKEEIKPDGATEVINVPKEVLDKDNASKKVVAVPPRIEKKPPVKKEVHRPAPIKKEPAPVHNEVSATHSRPQPIPEAKKPKRRGMSLISFLLSLLFVGFLVALAFALYNHEVSIENIVVYENDELIFKEAFEPVSIRLLGQDIEMNHAMTRKTSPLKVYKPTNSFPYWAFDKEIECNGCDYWTNVNNYELHHYPDKK